VFCVCNMPYNPDTDMLQCMQCADWCAPHTHACAARHTHIHACHACYMHAHSPTSFVADAQHAARIAPLLALPQPRVCACRYHPDCLELTSEQLANIAMEPFRCPQCVQEAEDGVRRPWQPRV
jgi:hypothetical protein